MIPSSSDEELIPTLSPAIAVQHVPPHNNTTTTTNIPATTAATATTEPVVKPISYLLDILNIEHYKCQNTPRTDWSPCYTWNKHYIIITWLFRPGQLLSPELALGIFGALLHQQTKRLLYWYSLLYWNWTPIILSCPTNLITGLSYIADNIYDSDS